VPNHLFTLFFPFSPTVRAKILFFFFEGVAFPSPFFFSPFFPSNHPLPSRSKIALPLPQLPFSDATILPAITSPCPFFLPNFCLPADPPPWPPTAPLFPRSPPFFPFSPLLHPFFPPWSLHDPKPPLHARPQKFMVRGSGLRPFSTSFLLFISFPCSFPPPFFRTAQSTTSFSPPEYYVRHRSFSPPETPPFPRFICLPSPAKLPFHPFAILTTASASPIFPLPFSQGPPPGPFPQLHCYLAFFSPSPKRLYASHVQNRVLRSVGAGGFFFVLCVSLLSIPLDKHFLAAKFVPRFAFLIFFPPQVPVARVSLVPNSATPSSTSSSCETLPPNFPQLFYPFFFFQRFPFPGQC